MQEPLKESIAGYMMKTVIKGRFEREGIPRWRERDVRRPWPILRKSGRLMRSVTAPDSQFAGLTITSKEATLESLVPYAPFHDKSRGKSSPGYQWGRPFLYFTEKNIDYCKKVLHTWAYTQCRAVGLSTSAIRFIFR